MKRLNWGPFSVAVVATSAAAVPGGMAVAWWLGAWWGWLILVLDAAVVLFLGASAVGVLRKHPDGGTVPAPSGRAEAAGIVSPGGPITDPDQAEALGLTVDARRLRQARQ